jgi:hypothetical protein
MATAEARNIKLRVIGPSNSKVKRVPSSTQSLLIIPRQRLGPKEKKKQEPEMASRREKSEVRSGSQHGLDAAARLGHAVAITSRTNTPDFAQNRC